MAMAMAGEPSRSDRLPLARLEVVEIGGSPACAMAGRILWELGANVHRLGRPEPDARIEILLHHGKHEWNPQIEGDAGGDIAAALAASADLILADGHDDEPFAESVRVACSELALRGAEGAVLVEFRQMFDGGAMAADELQGQYATGLSWRIGANPGEEQRPPVIAADDQIEYLTCLNGLVASLAVLYRRSAVRAAEVVHVARWVAVPWALDTHMLQEIYTGAAQSRVEVSGGHQDLMETADGRLIQTTIAGTDGHWLALQDVMGNPDWGKLYSTRAERLVGWDVISPLVSAWIAERSCDDLFSALQAKGVPAAPVRTMKEVVASAHLVERRYFRRGNALVPSVPRLPWLTSAHEWDPVGAVHGAALDRLPRRPPAANAPGGLGMDDAARGEPLAGVVVLDVGNAIAGPLTCQLMGFLGARVIKVESSTSIDVLRFMPPFGTPEVNPNASGLFNQFNQGKESVAIDLRSDEGRALFLALVKTADVVVENFSVGTMERLGLGYETLASANPRIVQVSLSGFGAFGPEKGLAAYGNQICAMSGLTDGTGYPDALPRGVGVYPDVPSGLFGAVAALAALRQRHGTGRGQHIDLAEIEVMTFFLPQSLAAAQGPLPATRRGVRSGRYAPQGAYRVRGEDAWVGVTVRTNTDWVALAELMAKPEWRGEPWLNLDYRLERAAEIDSAIQAWAAGRDPWEVTNQLQQAGIASHPYQTPHELLASSDYSRQATWDIDHPILGKRRHFRPAFRIGCVDRPPPAGSPILGEHTAQVLRDQLQLPDSRISALRDSGVLA